MVRTRIRDDQAEDIGFVSEAELNDFFVDVVITGTENDTNIITTFDGYFPNRGLITAGSGIIVTTGTNFVQITNTGAAGIPGSGISLEEHETIDSLVHGLAETQTTEIIRGVPGNKVTNVEVRTVPVTGTLIRSTDITRSNGKVTIVVENQHDESGVIIQTLTSTINRTGGKVTSVDVVET